MASNLRTHQRRRPTHLLGWCAAIICTVLVIAVVIVGVVIFIGYLVMQPSIPVISVAGAHLDLFQYNQAAGLLETQITIVIRVKNGNGQSRASFSETSFHLLFDGMKMAQLVADPFEVRKNDTVEFRYVVGSRPVPLNHELQEEAAADTLLMTDDDEIVMFELKGGSRTRWRVWILGSARFWCHLDCQLMFHPVNGSYIPSRCRSKAF